MSSISPFFALPSTSRSQPNSWKPTVLWGAGALVRGSDKRRDIRRSVNETSLSATLDGVRVDLLDVSAHGMSLRLPASLGASSSGEIDLEMLQGDVAIGRVALRLTHASPTESGTRVGGFIVGTEILPSGKTAAPKAGDVVDIRDEALRSRVLEHLASRSIQAAMRCESGATIDGVVQTGLDSSLIFRPKGEFVALPDGEQVSVEVTLNGTELVLEAIARATEPGVCVLSPITRILSVCRRRCERVELVPGIATLSWENPLDGDSTVSARVVDLSTEGLAIALPASSRQLLPAGPSSLTLRVRKTRMTLLGEVHSVRVGKDGSTLVGLRVKPLHHNDRLRLGRICQELRFPNLVSRRQADPSEIEELFRSSGYLDLRDGTAPSKTWHESPGDESLGIDLVHRAESGALLGHLSCTRIYPRTWLYHQLATVGLRRDRVAYPLYIQLMDWISTLTEGEGYALAYFDQHKSWHQTMLGAFTRWTASEALSLVAPLDRFEPAPDGRHRETSSLPKVIVREAEPADLPFASALARAHLPPLLADGLHFGASSMTAATLCREHEAFGLERSRTTLVVEAGGEIVGVAACETGAASLSLFNILNMAHVFFHELVAPGVARAAQGALLKSVRDFYGARGIALPLIVSPAGNTHYAEDAGLVHAETMGAWVTSSGGLKQWRNYIHFEMGGRAHRGRRQEKNK